MLNYDDGLTGESRSRYKQNIYLMGLKDGHNKTPHGSREIIQERNMVAFWLT